jgi:hypothetical protein
MNHMDIQRERSREAQIRRDYIRRQGRHPSDRWLLLIGVIVTFAACMGWLD